MMASELKQKITAVLFPKNKLTLGQASRLAKMGQLRFQHVLASWRIACGALRGRRFRSGSSHPKRPWSVSTVASSTLPIVDLAVINILSWGGGVSERAAEIKFSRGPNFHANQMFVIHR